jgi:hypothetical protein
MQAFVGGVVAPEYFVWCAKGVQDVRVFDRRRQLYRSFLTIYHHRPLVILLVEVLNVQEEPSASTPIFSGQPQILNPSHPWSSQPRGQ